MLPSFLGRSQLASVLSSFLGRSQQPHADLLAIYNCSKTTCSVLGSRHGKWQQSEVYCGWSRGLEDKDVEEEGGRRRSRARAPRSGLVDSNDFRFGSECARSHWKILSRELAWSNLCFRNINLVGVWRMCYRKLGTAGRTTRRLVQSPRDEEKGMDLRVT